MSDDIIEEELPVEEAPPIACAFCVQTGLVLVGWDDEGNEVLEPCGECGGDGWL